MAAIALFAALVGYLAVVAAANNDPSAPSQVFSDIESINEESDEQILLYTYLQLMEFDATDGVAIMRIFPFPNSSWGDSGVSSFEPDRTFYIDVDSVGARPIGEDSGNCSSFNADYIYGACDYTLDVPSYQGEGVNLKAIEAYPFDRYLINLSMDAEIGEGLAYEGEKNWNDLAIRPIEYTGRIGDFRASWRLVDGYGGDEFGTVDSALSSLNQGALSVNVALSRSVSTVFIVVILMLFTIVAACMLGVMAWSVYVGHRPPTLGSLVWGAATIFTMLQSRQEVFPSSPPIGVAMDLWFFFPALFASLLSTTALFALWIRRSDWVA